MWEEEACDWQEKFAYASYVKRVSSPKGCMDVQLERGGQKFSIELHTYFMEDPAW